MRFTGPDPAASPFHNLHAYCGNNPAAFCDPDGLARKKTWSNETFTADLIEAGLDIFEGVLMKTVGGAAAVGASGFQMLDGEHIGDTFVGQGVQEAGRRHRARSAQNGGGLWGYLNGAGGTISDMVGITGISESMSGRDNITGQKLSSHERYERFVDGASSGIALAGTMALGSPVAGAATRLSTRVVTAGARSVGRGFAATGRTLAGGARTIAAELRIPRGRAALRGGWMTGPSRPPVMVGGYRQGSFSIINWHGYPAGIPRPTGPFRLLPKAEYQVVRNAANNANRALHRAHPEWRDMQIHEIQPVKFGGSPTDPANKIALNPGDHYAYNAWWQRLKRGVTNR